MNRRVSSLKAFFDATVSLSEADVHTLYLALSQERKDSAAKVRAAALEAAARLSAEKRPPTEPVRRILAL